MRFTLPARRLFLLIAAVGLALGLFAATSASAHAAPAYPPTGPSSSSSQGADPSSVSVTNDPSDPAHGTDASTASTGFDSAVGILIAVGLLGGGLVLIAGSRRGRSHR